MRKNNLGQGFGLCSALFFFLTLSPISAQTQQRGLFDPAWRSIIPAVTAKQMLSGNLGQCSPAYGTIAKRPISNTWDIPQATVDELERRLPMALAGEIRQSAWIDDRARGFLSDFEIIRNHARQYAGITIGGKNFVLVVAMPIRVYDFDGPMEELHPGWGDRAFVGLCDGGPRQFSALYDPAAKAFSGFFFSGTIAGYTSPPP